MFVGREGELATLEAGLRDALSGNGKLFLVIGEPGIGKTRLADELAVRARGADALVLWGRCWEEGGAPPYWPWIQVLRSYLAATDSGRLLTSLGSVATDLVQILPEIRQSLPGIPPPSNGEPADPEGARFRLFDAVSSLLKAASRDVPLVLVFEDLYAADHPSLVLLQFFARELKDARIVVCGTYRELEAKRAPEISRIFTELARDGHVIALGGLDQDAVKRYVEQAVGEGVAPELGRALHELTEGNPLFVGEVLRALKSRGELRDLASVTPGRLAVPQGIRDLMGERLDELSEACRSLLTIAAVAGREFDPSLLGELSKQDRETVEELLDEAAEAEVIEEIQGPSPYRFSHSLIRETLYDELRAGRRRRLHRDIGEALERMYSNRIDLHMPELAHHFLGAGQAVAPERAVGYAKRAGDRANAILAYEEAAAYYARALEALDLHQVDDDGLRCELTLAQGGALGRGGDIPTAKEVFLRAAEIARRHGDSEMLGRSALGYGAGFAGPEGITLPGQLDPVLIPLLVEALEALPATDGALRVRLLGRVAVALYWDESEDDRRASLGEEAVAMAKRLGDPGVLAAALSSKRYALWGPDNVDERVAYAADILRLAQQASDWERALQAHRWRVFDFLEMADVTEAEREIQTHDRIAKEVRQPLSLGYTLVFRAGRALSEGKFADGERMAHEALQIGLRTGNPLAHAIYVQQLMWSRYQQGDAHDLLSSMVELVRKFSPGARATAAGLATAYARLGDHTEARKQLENLGDLTKARRDLTWFPMMDEMAEVACMVEDKTRAKILCELLTPYQDRICIYGPPFYLDVGPVARVMGNLAALVGDTSSATRHYENALTISTRVRARPILARTQHSYAAMLVETGENARAAALAREAFATATELGMRPLAEQTKAMIDRLEIEIAPAPPESPPSTAARLLREEEFWALSYDGKTVRLRDTKGLAYLAFLLARPGRECHVLELVRPDTSVAAAPTDPELSPTNLGDAGPLLDDEAKRAYRRRLSELREELEEATQFGDSERAARVDEEIEALTRELARAVGLGGRDRRASSAAERARQNVARAVKATIERIGRANPALGAHLAATIRTGYFCSYTPDPRAPIVWTV